MKLYRILMVFCVTDFVTSQTKDESLSELVLDLTRRLSAVEKQYYDLKLQQDNDRRLISDLQSQLEIDKFRIDELQDQLNFDQNLIAGLQKQQQANKHQITLLRTQQQINRRRSSDLDKQQRCNESDQRSEPVSGLQRISDREAKQQQAGEPRFQENISEQYVLGKMAMDNNTSSAPYNRFPRVSPVDGKVAFHAVLTHAYRSPSKWTEIRFDKVITNVGNSYDGQTGTFTCAKQGLYVFSWTMQISVHFLSTDLIRNGNVITSSYTGDDISYNENGSGFAIIELEERDRVWIRVHDIISGAQIIPFFSTFSGFLL